MVENGWDENRDLDNVHLQFKRPDSDAEEEDNETEGTSAGPPKTAMDRKKDSVSNF